MIAYGIRSVLIAGSGEAGATVARGLAKATGGEVAVELISPDAAAGCAATVNAGLGTAWHSGAVARVDCVRDAIETTAGDHIEFDVLVLAPGAHRQNAVDHAICLGGPAEDQAVSCLRSELHSGAVRAVTFAVPSGVTWPLPLYELAVRLARSCAERALAPDLRILTSEPAPLGMFGTSASRRVADLLRHFGIQVIADPRLDARDLERERSAGRRLVSVPRLSGPRIAGLSSDANGFLRVDGNGLVEGTTNVYAAGDVTSFPVKQRAIARRQADAVVASITARRSTIESPRPFRPVVRGLRVSSAGPVHFEPQVSGAETAPASDELLAYAHAK